MTNGRGEFNQGDFLSMRVNFARGLCSLSDQALWKMALRFPLHAGNYAVMAGLMRELISRVVPDEDLTVLELARRAGIVPAKPKRKRRQLLPARQAPRATKSKPKRRRV